MAVTIEALIEHFNLEVLVEGGKGKLINVSHLNIINYKVYYNLIK